MKLFSALFIVVLLAGSVQAQGLFGERPEPGQMPSRFVRVDGVDAGFLASSDGPLTSVRLARGTCVLDRIRFGVAACELTVGGGGDWPTDMRLLVHAGYTLWSRPKKTGCFWSSVPDVYAEAACGIMDANWQVSPTFRASVGCDIDYFGVGGRVEAGWLSLHEELYIGAQVRLLTFGIGF
jgi:hypothetical protein